jgi:curli production assembly/transport component CsgG
LKEKILLIFSMKDRSSVPRQNISKMLIKTPLPPLLYAGILLEGELFPMTAISLQEALSRYFGIGASTQYRQDRITIYLRAVSTLNGEILKTVYTSKTILSTSVNGSFFRYIDTERLLEAEVGLTQNEPVQLAVTEAIESSKIPYCRRDSEIKYGESYR